MTVSTLTPPDDQQPPSGLTMEQQFKLASITHDVNSLPIDKVREYLIEVVRQGMYRDNLFKIWLKEGKL